MKWKGITGEVKWNNCDEEKLQKYPETENELE